ncbi:MAG: ATP-binding protein [Pseudomonadota bacterium]
MLRRFLPKSLYARVVLIVILPIFLMQSFITYIFFARHWDFVTANLSRTTAGQIGLITDLYVASSDEESEALFSRTSDLLDLSIRHEPGQIPEANQLSPYNLYNPVFEARLRSRLERDYWLNTQTQNDMVEVRVQLEDGFLTFLIPEDRVFATSGPIFLAWLVGTSILLGWIATVFLRNQVRSILKLASAAEAFGRGRDDPGFRPTGATEVRRAGRAFIAMRERINRHLDQRTTMLAGVSHDLRTPLTRMKLTLAFTPDEQDIEAMRSDVAEMERMVEAYLEFASDVATTGDPEMFDLAALTQEIVEKADPQQARVVFTPGTDELIIEARLNGIRRAVTNLVGNGLKYATKVWVSTRRAGTHVEIIVEDDGPGISPEHYEEAFKPFHRLDEARTPQASGVGLGLSVVRDVARRHGGEIVLSRSNHGGLRAALRIPV